MFHRDVHRFENPSVQSMVRHVFLTLWLLSCATLVVANDLPVSQNPELAHFGYYYADIENDYLDEIRPQANIYVAVPRGYAPQTVWQPERFRTSLIRANQLQMDIMLLPTGDAAEQARSFRSSARLQAHGPASDTSSS